MFDIIDDILTTKLNDSLNRNDFNDEFNLYMIQRWLSIHSDLNVELLNSTINTLYNTLDNEQYYKLLMEIIPPTKRRRKYIKNFQKNKDINNKDGIDISNYFEESSKKINESLKYVLGDKNKDE